LFWIFKAFVEEINNCVHYGTG